MCLPLPRSGLAGQEGEDGREELSRVTGTRLLWSWRASDRPALGGLGGRADVGWPWPLSKTWLVSVVVEFASPCGVGPAGRTRAFFLKCNKIYQGTGHAAVGLWDLLPGPLRLRPGRHYSGGRWAGGWCGRVGWATPVGAAVTPFLINGSWVDHLPLPRAGPSRPRAGEGERWQTRRWFGASGPQRRPRRPGRPPCFLHPLIHPHLQRHTEATRAPPLQTAWGSQGARRRHSAG